MANTITLKRRRQRRRKMSVRRHVYGTAERPRLAIFRSARHIYAQVIDDAAGRTLASSSTMDKEIRGDIKQGGNCAAAVHVGADVATKAMAAGVSQVVFDRGGFHYHGRLKSLADAAREKGLKF